jgi:hypothetical protein
MVHWLSYSQTHWVIHSISCVNYSLFTTVNDNSSILSLLILSPILSANVCIIVYIDLLCVGSTHLHGIRADRLLNKRYTKCFLQVQKIEDNGKMEFQKEFILTPYNYFAWKEKISIHLQTRGLYRLTLNTDTESTSTIEKSKYLNLMDETLGTICSLISPNLIFHMSSCKTPNEAWKTLEGLFGKHDEMRGHMLEVELLTLNPKIFDNIQGFFTKFKDLLLQLKACGVDKLTEEKQMVLTILSKLGPEFSIFVSTFHTVRFAFGATWKMPSLEDFIESLTQEQTKLINMDTIKGSRAHALTVHDAGHTYHKSKDKDKRKAHAHPKNEGYTKPFTDASGSKGEKGRK